MTVTLALVFGVLVVAPAASAVETPAHEGEHDQSTNTHQQVSTESSIAAAAQDAADDGAGLAQGITLPTGFADVRAIGNMSEATSVDFAPDGTAFVALKTGIVKSFDYNAATDEFEGNATSTNFADLSTNVNNYWDRGLTGIAVDPQFGTAGHNYVYVNYTYNRDPRDATPVVPKWGTPGQQYDECPAPATTDPPRAGCVVMMRVTRLSAVKNSLGWEMTGQEKELLASGCFQFGSHASGDVAFGPDGKLYASAGEGASFDTLDYGQYLNPCADPTNEGGSLRSQDHRSGGDALGVDGSVVKMDPANGFTPSQATANSWLVAYGQRNPWRLTFRPGSTELWSGDVGASSWEEINRIPDVGAVTSPINRGWPCYEGTHAGSAVQPGWNALDLPLCEGLYAQGTSAVAAPYFSYETRGPLLTPGEDCQNDTSSVSGIAFGSASSNYPAAYEGAMFFSDYARSCIWVLGKNPDGDPDPSQIQPFVQAAETPVDLVTGPGGDLYYVDYGLDENGVPSENAAGVHRIVYTGSNAAPTAKILANPASGPAPLAVSFDGTTSTDPDGDPLTYSWDLDGNGTFGDSTAAKPQRTYTIGTYTVSLRIDDGHGHTSTATQQIQAGNTAPVLGTVTPAASLTWTVGQTVGFSATATDQQQGAMPASAFSWNLAIRHCPNGVCHTHSLSTFTGVSSGSFQAPDHEYPSHLLLTVTVTDSGGLTDTRTIQLDPKTVQLSFASSPSGATVTVNGADHTTPYAETFLQGSRVTVTAAPTHGSSSSAFGTWSDGGARSHELSAPATATTYTATYKPTAALSASPTSGPAPLTVSYTATATNAPGVSGGFSFAWDLDNDGQYDDGSGATQSRTYGAAGSPVVGVRATDSRGVADAKAVTVTVGPANRNPDAAMSANPTSGHAPLTVSFSAAGSTDPDGDPVSYAWDLDNDGSFDDGTSLTASSTYAGVGQKTARMRVSDNRGGSDIESVTITVTNRNPVAVATADPTSGPAPLAVSFDASGSSDPDGTALTYAWDTDSDGQFDDGTSASAQRTFTALGNHTATVRVTDANGGTATQAVTVTVTNSGPVARITGDPASGSGPAPLTVGFDASTSTDPDGGPLSYAWDLDGDGLYDDGTAATATRTYPVGTVGVGLKVTDGHGGSATATMQISATNLAPTVDRVTVYPAGAVHVGQTLGFDAAATDPQQDLPASAYTVVIQRQDCDAGCPRTELQRRTGVTSGQFVVPQLPHPSHLYVAVTVTDDHGATATREVRLDPRPVTLEVRATKRLEVRVDGLDRRGGWSGQVVAGTTVRLVAPRQQVRRGVRWVFVRWTDGGSRKHDVTLWDPSVRVRAVYREARGATARAVPGYSPALVVSRFSGGPLT